MLELKKIEEGLFQPIYRLFEDDSFYFGTKRPKTLTEGDIRKIILKDYNAAFLIFHKGMPIGILGTKENKYHVNSLNMDIRSRDMDLLLENIEVINKWLLDFQQEYQELRAQVFNFDDYGKILYKNLSFQREAVLKGHVYKFNQYHDVLLFAKKVN